MVKKRFQLFGPQYSLWAAANFLDDVGSCIFKERFLFDPDGVSIVAIRFLRNLSSSVL